MTATGGQRGESVHQALAFGPGNWRIGPFSAMAEHSFRVINRQSGHGKTRYRGPARNRAQLFTLFARGNPFPVRHRLTG